MAGDDMKSLCDDRPRFGLVPHAHLPPPWPPGNAAPGLSSVGAGGDAFGAGKLGVGVPGESLPATPGRALSGKGSD